MPWLRLGTVAQADAADAAAARLADAGAVAVSMLPNSASDEELEPAPGETPLRGRVRVEGLFDLGGDAATRRIAALDGFDADFVAERDWSETWRDGFGPLRFGRLVVTPASMPVSLQPGDVAVRLDPGLAFGTGAHPSTALCLGWLAGQCIEGKSVLDVGCGSGILAIAAARLGAGKVVAVDHDPQARRATAANACRNGVSLTVASDLREVDGRFDLVVANIVADTLRDLADELAARAEALALSGILPGQTETLMGAFQSRFRFDPPTVRDGWALLRGRRRP